MRFGLAPAYLSYAEIWDAVEILKECVRGEVWREPRYRLRHAVT
jgi:kynureninase